MVRADALWFGTGVHVALAEWYLPGFTRGPHPAETWEKWVGQTQAWMRDGRRGDPDQPEWVDARDLGVAMLTGYVQRYGQDEQWELIQPEYAFHVLVGSPQPVVNYVGTFDGVFRDHADGKVKLLENKTAASISTKHLVLDDQAGSYWAVATHELRHQDKIGPRESLWGIEYNFLRKGLPDDRPRNAAGLATNLPTKQHYVEQLVAPAIPGSHWTESGLKKLSKEALENLARDNGIAVLGDVSKVQPAPLYLRTAIRRTANERARQLDRIQDEVEHMDAVRSGELPVTKNPTRDCTFCVFAEMCELHEVGGDWETYRDFAFHAEDPYGDHRPGARSSKLFKER
jgi:hypothetical protein